MDQLKVARFVDFAIRNNYSYQAWDLRSFTQDEMQEALSMLLLRVEARENELRHLVETLEQRVNERTQELVEKNRRLEELATHDELTRLFNRRYFNEKLAEYSLLSERFGHKLSCIMTDIDHFKIFNDNFGHQAGDYVLVNFARAIRESIRRTDICSRYGGEEFVALLPNTDLGDAQEIAEKMRRKVESNTLVYLGQVLRITASFGAACGSTHDELGDILVKNADDKMYEAKQNGRNRVCCANG